MGEKNQNLTKEGPKIALLTDFDDTLFLAGEPGRTAENVRAIFELRETGNVVALASGRSLSSLMRNCPEFIACFDDLILDNGAICFEMPENLVAENLATRNAQDLAEAENLRELFAFTISPEFCAEIMEFLKNRFPETELAGIFYYDSYEHEEPKKAMTKIRFWAKSTEAAEAVARAVAEKFGAKLHVYLAKNKKSTGIAWVSAEYNSFIDLAAIEAGKERAISRLAAMKFPGARIITVGDGGNDVEMIKKFNGFMVAGAEAEATAENGHVVESVAKLVEKIMKGEV